MFLVCIFHYYCFMIYCIKFFLETNTNSWALRYSLMDLSIYF
jgi:hypothetical protein